MEKFLPQRIKKPSPREGQFNISQNQQIYLEFLTEITSDALVFMQGNLSSKTWQLRHPQTFYYRRELSSLLLS